MRHNFLSALMLWLLAECVCSAWAQETAPAPPAETAALAAQPPDVAGPEPIKFSFKGATFQQVIEYFSRVTRLPVVWQSPAPEGTLDFVSDAKYDLPGALRVLNIILQSRGVMLRVSDDMLYLQKLDAMQKEDIPTFVGTLPAEGDVTADQIVTVVRPLRMAMSKALGEKLASMVGSYGAVTAIEQSNTSVITETAANVRRLLTIIEQLDQEDPEGAVEVFSIRHAQAEDLMKPLRALLSQKVEKFVINQQGQQVKIEEDQMPGLAISADERTNSIIAKGQQAKVNKLREALALLDVPATSAGGLNRTVMTLPLNRTTPADAANRLNQLYQRIPEKERPTVIALDDAGKVMIVGDDVVVAEGRQLVRELDGDATTAADSEPVVALIAMQQAAPQGVISTASGLLTKRQQAATRLVAGADGRSIIVSGAASDVDAVKALVPMLDRASAGDQQVRLVRIAADDAPAVVAKARELYQKSIEAVEPRDSQMNLSVDFDAEARLVSLIGTQRALDAFTNTLRQIEASITIDRETRRIELSHVLPSEIAGAASALANQVLQPTDGRAFIAPSITPLDQINTLLVTATPEQLAVIEPLIANLDVDASGAASSAGAPLRIMQLRIADAGSLAGALMARYNARPAMERKLRPVNVAADWQTNSLLVTADPALMPEIEAIVDELNTTEKHDVEGREIRVFQLKVARADALARTVDEMFPQPPVPVDVRGRPQPHLAKPREVTVRSDPQTNSLVVMGTAAALNFAEEMVNQLDVDPSTSGGASSRSIRVLTPVNADAQQLATSLEAMFNTPDQLDVRPVIRVDSASNSLLVRASDDQFKTIEQVVAKVDDAAFASSRQLRVLPIDASRADAAAVARALQQMMDRNGGNTGNVEVITLEELLKRQSNNDSEPAKGSSSMLPIHELLNAMMFAVAEPVQAQQSNPGVTIAVDKDSNSLVLIGSSRAVERALALARQIQDQIPAAASHIRVITTPATLDVQGTVNSVNQVLDRYTPAGGQSGDVRRRSAIIADPAGGAIVVAANDTDFKVISDLIAAFAAPQKSAAVPIRAIALQRADAGSVAAALKQFFNERAQMKPGGAKPQWTVSVMAVDSSNTLLVAAPEEDFADIEAMVKEFDSAESGAGLTFRVFQLKHARAADVARTVQQMVSDLIWSQPESIFFWQRPQTQPKKRDNISVRADPRINAVIVTGRGDKFDMVQQLVEMLDVPRPEEAENQAILIIDLKNISPETAKGVIETIGLDKPQPLDSSSRLVSEPIKVSQLQGAGRNAIVIVANPADRDTILGLLKAIDTEPAMAEAHTQVIRLKHAQAAALAQILSQILNPSEQQAQTPLARAVREQVRRLAVSGGAGQQQPTTLDLTSPIRVIADPSLNALVVSSTKDNAPAMVALIDMFDQLPITESVTVQIFPLQNIAAEQFSRIVRDLFTQGKSLGRTAITRVPGLPEGAAGAALLEEIAISTDERTNTVVVAGSETAVALVDVLSKRIDTGVTAGWVEPRIVPLRYADAADLASTLQAIIVEGTTNLPQSTPLQRQIGRLRMAKVGGNGNGEKVLEADVFVPMTRLVIRAEPQMNALILVGTPDNIEIITELVAMLDVESASPADAVRIYPVENASASRLATTIKQLFDQQVQSKSIRPEDRVIIQADERTNALVVATSSRSFAVLEGMLKTLDAKIAPELREIRTIDVKNASAPRLASLVQQMMDARLERLRKVQPETADLERATIVADPRTNALVIAAGNDTFEVIKRIATDLDVATLGDAATVHVIPVTTSNADRLAQTINRLMERRYADMPAELRNSQRPLVLTDPGSNSLLVAASPEDLGTVQELVNKLAGAPTNPAVGLHVITLGPEVRAETMAPRVQRLMQERLQSLGAAGTPSDRVSVEADLASNSLIIAASDENFDAISNLVDVLTKAAAAPGAPREDGGIEPREVEIVTLRSSRAADMVDLLDELYVREAVRTRGQGAIRVTADERLNAVVINAPGNDVRSIKDLIAQLDGAKPASVVEIKYVPLQSANALETVSLIENVIRGRGLGDRRNPRQATVLKYLREIAQQNGDAATQPAGGLQPVEMEVSAAIRESITLTPDLRTNTIIVSAPRESVAMIERMIRDLDDSSTGSKNIRIFKLTNADALAMAEILTDLFNIRRGSNMYVLKPREDQAVGASALSDGGVGSEVASVVATPALEGGAAGITGTELTAIPDERQQLAITVDSRTNSLIVSGTPNYLDLVEQVVNQLDSLEATEREVYVYQLRNAVADEVARVVGGFVDTEQKKLVATLGSDQIGSAARLLEREITIQGDTQSNTVLVSASPRYMERVKEMIHKLDVDPPQVLIQVMLAEVTLDSRDEWGVNMQMMFDIGSATVSGGYGLARGFVNGLGVPNLAITSDDFSLLIRAMQSQGRLQVLSNPSIMAANNSPARIQIGETIQIPTSSSISNAGNVFSTVANEDIGVILDVTPSINPDGFVRMTINPEISSLSNRTTQISEDFQSPIITRRTADTTVTVHDGQTIVLGGLISDRFEKRDRKVPVLGDLPLVGKLFRADREETATTELLIVLTPHVIESPTNFARVDQITQGEIDRLSVPPHVKEGIRRSILEGTGGLYDAQGNRIDVKEQQEAAENP